MGQLYYAQTQLYSTVLGVKISGQYELKTSRSTTHFSEFIFLGSSRKFSTRAKFLYDEYVLLSPPI